MKLLNLKPVHYIFICITIVIIAITIVFAVSETIRAETTRVLAQTGILPAPEITHVTLAVPVPFLDDYGISFGFVNSINLAIEEIASMNLPVTLDVRVDVDEGDFSKAVELAHGYINDPSVIGVIGHWGSAVCLPISAIYAREQQTMIVPTVTISSLTIPPSDYIFRNTHSDGYTANRIVEFAVLNETQRAVIFYEDSPYGFEMSVELERYAGHIGIEIVDRVTTPATHEELIMMERRWRAAGYDTVFIISNYSEGVTFLYYLWELGFEGAVICSDGMDTSYIYEFIEHYRDPLNPGIFAIISLFNPTHTHGAIFEFVERYRNRFGVMPEAVDLQMYDSIMIAVHAIAEHDVRTSSQLSEYFRTIDNLHSVFGNTYFNDRHEVVGKSVYFKQWTGTQFVYHQINQEE